MTATSPIELRIRAACDAKQYADAATLALKTYGDELMSYLVAILRNAVDADDVFSSASESLWQSLPSFRWDSSLRTYAYAIARHAAFKHLRDPRRRRESTPLSNASVEAVVAEVRSRTATFLRTESRDKIAALRAQLAPDDQTLLILRVNRKLAWRDIAAIMNDDELDDDALGRRAAALRKRFERLKVELRARAAIG
jgi:RNA polymerase sigma-70 factor (ECF subfamily)